MSESWREIRQKNKVDFLQYINHFYNVSERKKQQLSLETPVTVTIRKKKIFERLYMKQPQDPKFFAAITRWLFTRKILDVEQKDPILSTGDIPDLGFLIYMKKEKSGIDLEKCLREESSKIISEIEKYRGFEGEIDVVNGPEYAYMNLTSEYVNSNEAILISQLEKLRGLYNSSLSKDTKKNYRDYFHSVYMYVTTYSSLKSEGYQGSISLSVFNVLERHLGVTTELFASPLNSTLSNFCSGFPFIDQKFGSLGSFFDVYEQLFSKGGSFECNPPFTEEHILYTAKIIDSSLSKYHQVPLSVVLILPSWEDTAGFPILFNSHHKRLFLSLRRNMHYYVEKNSRNEQRYRLSSANSHIFVLQNQLGADSWPITNDFVVDILWAFRQRE